MTTCVGGGLRKNRPRLARQATAWNGQRLNCGGSLHYGGKVRRVSTPASKLSGTPASGRDDDCLGGRTSERRLEEVWVSGWRDGGQAGVVDRVPGCRRLLPSLRRPRGGCWRFHSSRRWLRLQLMRAWARARMVPQAQQWNSKPSPVIHSMGTEAFRFFIWRT